MATVQEILEDYVLNRDDNYGRYAVTSLILYDYLLTLSREVELVWHSQRSPAKYTFFYNRYCVLLWAFYVVISLLRSSQTSCVAEFIVSSCFDISFFATWAVFSALRVWAISGRDWRPTSLTLALGLVPVATNMLNYIRSKAAYGVGLNGSLECIYSSRLSVSLNNKMVIATRSCAIASDVVVLVAIWAYTRHSRRVAHGLNQRFPLVTMFLRSGCLYFIILLTMNVIDIVLWTTTDLNGIVSDFIAPFTSMMMTHCLLDLRGTLEMSNEDDATELEDLLFVSPGTVASS